MGSPALLKHIIKSGITSFYDEPWTTTDHRGIFIDFDEIGVFGATVHTPLPTIQRVITSKSRPIIKKFLEEIDKQQMVEEVHKQLTTLRSKSQWERTDHDKIEKIDQDSTNTLLTAEKSSGIPKQHSWSPTLHTASQIYEYWCIVAKSRTNNIQSTTQLQKIAEKLPSGSVFQGNPGRNMIGQLKRARKTLIDARQKSEELRDEFLPLQQELMVEQGKISKARAIQCKRTREQQQRCWRKFQVMRQDQRAPGGISHVLLRTDESTPQRINDKDELDAVLLHRNIDHFQQAQGTPLTILPLLDILGQNRCSQEAFEILDGKIPNNITPTAKKILKQATRVREPINLAMSLDDMCIGFKKWKEQTTTSPLKQKSWHLQSSCKCEGAQHSNYLRQKQENATSNIKTRHHSKYMFKNTTPSTRTSCSKMSYLQQMEGSS
jgi:hypothetical protein